jgi:hypothetical protein
MWPLCSCEAGATDVANLFTLTALKIPRYVEPHGNYYRARLIPANVLPFREETLSQSFSVAKDKS